jgi:hypothetical protein
VKQLPNFLIIGAAKSGTTSLHDYLHQHPEIFLAPSKEPNYFALEGIPLPQPGPAVPEVLFELLYRHSVVTYDDYLAQFAAANGKRAIGEASVRYLYYEHCASRISAAMPDVKLIAILREPVSRLYSHYCMNVQYQLEPLSLRDAIAAEESRRAAQWGWDWHYVAVGRYAEQLKRYFAVFDRAQVKVFLYDELLQRPGETYQEVCRFLGIDDRFVPDMSDRGKVAARPRNRMLDRWLHWPNPVRARFQRQFPWLASAVLPRLVQLNSGPVPPLDKASRNELAPLFRDEVKELEDVLGRRVPWYA